MNRDEAAEQPRKRLTSEEGDEETNRCQNAGTTSGSSFKHLLGQEEEIKRVFRRVFTSASRGAVVGAGLRGGLHVLSYTLRIVSMYVSSRRRQPGLISRKKWISTDFVKRIVSDTVTYGLFMGSFSGSFVLLDEFIAHACGRYKTRSYRALLSGFISGSSLMLAGHDKHTSLALFIFLKGLVLLVRCGNIPLPVDRNTPELGNHAQDSPSEYAPLTNSQRRAWVRWLLTPTRYAHGDIVLMCLAMSQLGYSWIVMPSTLSGSYVRFLNRHGAKGDRIMDAIREMCERGSRNLPPTTLRSLSRISSLKDMQPRVPCEFIHPGQSCTSHAIKFFPGAYGRALPVYLPVYIIPAILVHRQKLFLKDSAADLWPKILKGCLRSSLFLSLFVTVAWRSVCFAFQTTGGASGRIIAMSCWVSGLALLAEKKNRRMELAIYALSKSLEGLGMSLVEWGYVPRWKNARIDVLLFSMAAAAICHCYSDHNGLRRDVFGGKYLNVLDFIFGNTGFQNEGRIIHVPSNMEIVGGLSHRVRNLAKSIGQDLASLSRVVSRESMAISEEMMTSSSDED
jgi:hypothetical protein